MNPGDAPEVPQRRWGFGGSQLFSRMHGKFYPVQESYFRIEYGFIAPCKDN